MSFPNNFCVSIAGPSYKEAKAQMAKELFVEFRLDLWKMSTHQRKKLFELPSSFIATSRLSSESAALKQLHEAVKHGADYIDCDIQRSEDFIHKIIELTETYNIKTIGSYHNFDTTPSEEILESIVKAILNKGFDIVKIATSCNTQKDISILESLLKKYPSIIIMGMGQYGKASRIKLVEQGCEYTYVSPFENSKTATGQLTKEEFLHYFTDANKNGIITLIGFMGSGKSTTGNMISKMLNYKFIDLDSEIVKRQKRSIPQIFDMDGEDHFRRIESEILIESVNSSNTVISCGGGIILNAMNRKLLKNLTQCFWLDVNYHECLSRIQHDPNRPIASHIDLKKIYSERLKHYKNTCDFHIKPKTHSAEEVCNQILQKLSLLNESHRL